MLKKYAAKLVRICAALLAIFAVVFFGRGLWEKWYGPLLVQAEPEFSFSETVLVNNDHPIPEEYSPELAECGDILLHKAASASWERLVAAAEKNGIKLSAALGYCAPDESENISDDSSSGLQQSCHEPAYRNEHNLGLAVDVNTNDEGWEWLNKNMYKYGFVLRYPENKESVTGTAAQESHLRYVGTEAAKTMTKKKLVLEEYLTLVG